MTTTGNSVKYMSVMTYETLQDPKNIYVATQNINAYDYAISGHTQGYRRGPKFEEIKVGSILLPLGPKNDQHKLLSFLVTYNGVSNVWCVPYTMALHFKLEAAEDLHTKRILL